MPLSSSSPYNVRFHYIYIRFSSVPTFYKIFFYFFFWESLSFNFSRCSLRCCFRLSILATKFSSSANIFISHSSYIMTIWNFFAQFECHKNIFFSQLSSFVSLLHHLLYLSFLFYFLLNKGFFYHFRCFFAFSFGKKSFDFIPYSSWWDQT